MQQLSLLGTDADQLVTVGLTDGSSLQLEFIFRPAVLRWFVNIDHPDLTLNGLGLSTHPNLLRAWRNLISFGLAVTSTDGADPFDINDFANGRISVYALSSAEVLSVEQDLFSQTVVVL